MSSPRGDTIAPIPMPETLLSRRLALELSGDPPFMMVPTCNALPLALLIVPLTIVARPWDNDNAPFTVPLLIWTSENPLLFPVTLTELVTAPSNICNTPRLITCQDSTGLEAFRVSMRLLTVPSVPLLLSIWVA
ncbi:hypothetical protein [Pseudomonas sp. COR18]|uniref:hypothetical protein n=1 Tax=Pseudomonas sp. COR18 TaxID=3399680 RepID=UPI003B003A0E